MLLSAYIEGDVFQKHEHRELRRQYLRYASEILSELIMRVTKGAKARRMTFENT